MICADCEKKKNLFDNTAQLNTITNTIKTVRASTLCGASFVMLLVRRCRTISNEFKNTLHDMRNAFLSKSSTMSTLNKNKTFQFLMCGAIHYTNPNDLGFWHILDLWHSNTFFFCPSSCQGIVSYEYTYFFLCVAISAKHVPHYANNVSSAMSQYPCHIMCIHMHIASVHNVTSCICSRCVCQVGTCSLSLNYPQAYDFVWSHIVMHGCDYHLCIIQQDT